MLRRGLWKGPLRVVSDAQSPGDTPAGLCLVLQGDWQCVAPGAGPRALAAGQGFWWAGEGGATPGQLEPLHAGADADAPALVWIALQRGAAPKI